MLFPLNLFDDCVESKGEMPSSLWKYAMLTKRNLTIKTDRRANLFKNRRISGFRLRKTHEI